MNDKILAVSSSDGYITFISISETYEKELEIEEKNNEYIKNKIKKSASWFFRGMLSLIFIKLGLFIPIKLKIKKTNRIIVCGAILKNLEGA